MKKFKWLLILVAVGLVVKFIHENWRPSDPLTLLGFELVQLPNSLIICICLVVGFGTGWLGHYWRQNRRRRARGATVSPAE